MLVAVLAFSSGRAPSRPQLEAELFNLIGNHELIQAPPVIAGAPTRIYTGLLFGFLGNRGFAC